MGFEDELFEMRGIGYGKGHRKMIAQFVSVVKLEHSCEGTMHAALDKG